MAGGSGKCKRRGAVSGLLGRGGWPGGSGLRLARGAIQPGRQSFRRAPNLHSPNPPSRPPKMRNDTTKRKSMSKSESPRPSPERARPVQNLGDGGWPPRAGDVWAFLERRRGMLTVSSGSLSFACAQRCRARRRSLCEPPFRPSSAGLTASLPRALADRGTSTSLSCPARPRRASRPCTTSS